MLLLFGALLTLAIPLLALRGRGRRQLYVHAAIAALPFGGALIWLGQTAPPVDEKTMSTAQVNGTIFITEYFPVLGIVLLVAGLQSVIAALLRPATTPPTTPEWIRQQ
jgi:hypothetical protein